MSGHLDDDVASEAALRRRLGGDQRYGSGPQVQDHKVRLAVDLVDATGVAEQLASWRAEDRARSGKGPGGRPPLVKDRTVLALMVLLATGHTSLHVARMEELVACRLSDAAKTLVGLDPAQLQAKRGYDRLWRGLHRALDVVDPFPIKPAQGGDRRTRMTKSQLAQVVAARDPEDCKRKQQRLNWLTNQLLEATWQLLPRHVRRRWKGNLCVDATVVPAFGQRAPRRSSEMAASEPEAAWYTHQGDHRDGVDDQGKGRKRVYWGWEDHLVVMVSNTGEPTPGFPLLVLGASLDKPGHGIAENAMVALASIAQRGHCAGLLVADRAYLPNSKVEKLQLPANALGYGTVHDYRSDQLGLTEGHAGAIQVEGSWYCPSMPTVLVDATKDFRDGVIDDTTWQHRIDQRRRYALRHKERPDAEGHARLMCPAVGPNATAACPLKPTRNQAGKTIITVVPAYPDAICTNKTSVTFPPTVGAKYGQTLPYGTPEWQDAYSRPRNTIEGYNGYVKDPNREALADPLRRRVRGYTACSVFATILVMSANLRKIDKFLTKTQAERTNPKPTRRARRRTTTLADFLPSPVQPAAQDPPAAA